MTTSTSATLDNVALGAMFFGTFIDEDTSFALLDRYVDAGGSWIDTADCYAFWADPTGFGAQSEELLGRWLAARPGIRERVRIATKVGCECVTPNSWPERSEGLAPDVIAKVAQQSLRRMGIEHIGLFWTHRDDREVDQADMVAAFGKLVADGTVGRLGHSNTALWRTERARGIAAAQGVAGPTALQLRYSYLQPRPMWRENSHRFGRLTDEALDLAATEPEIMLWAYSPLMSGAYERADRPLTEAYDHPGTQRRLAALATAADDLGVTRSEVVVSWLVGGTPPVMPIIGVSSIEQLEVSLDGARRELPEEVRAALDAAR
jgi:aryl-alcohol dehydrogenase-like predicted oxidoreductase